MNSRSPLLASNLLQELKTAVQGLGVQKWLVNVEDECPTADAVLRTPAFAAFFKIVPSIGELKDLWNRCQGEVAGVRGEGRWPRDLELVLMVAEQPCSLEAGALVERIVSDRLVCRKFVLQLNGDPLTTLLANLPFWPMPELHRITALPVSEGIRDKLVGFDYRLLTDLAAFKPGVAAIVKSIFGRKYELTASSKDKKGPATRRTRKDEIGRRIQGIDISNFRGIKSLSGNTLDLSADITVIYGPNGTGKTSLVDALEWAISGRVQRIDDLPEEVLRKGPDPIVYLFSGSEAAEVVVHLSGDRRIRRRGGSKTISREIGDKRAKDDREVIDYVVGTHAPPGGTRLQMPKLRSLFRGSHILGQHDVRAFLEQRSPEDRFDALTNMIGAEEFVRFREKTGKVRQELHRKSRECMEAENASQREIDSLKKGMSGSKRRIAEVHAILAPEDDVDLALRELESKAQAVDCQLDARVFLAEGLSQVERVKALLAQVDALTPSRKEEIETATRAIGELEQELPTQLESKAEMARIKEAVETDQRRLKALREKLTSTKARVSALRKDVTAIDSDAGKAEKVLEQLTWVQEELPRHHELEKEHTNLIREIKEERQACKKNEAELGKKTSQLQVSKKGLAKIEKAVLAATERVEKLTDLLACLPDVLRDIKERQVIVSHQKLLRQESEQLEKALHDMESRAKRLAKSLNKAKSEHDITASCEQERHGLLARLYELVDSSTCPLCGKKHASVDQAKTIMRQQLSVVPAALTELASNFEKARKESEEQDVRVRSRRDEIAQKQTELAECAARSKALGAVKTKYMRECTSVGMAPPKENPPAWRGVLKRALEGAKADAGSSKTEDKEAEIRALADDVDQGQAALQASREKLKAKEETQRQLVSSISRIESEMGRRGFTAGVPGRLEGIRSEVEQARKQCEDLNSKKGRAESLLSKMSVGEQDLRSTISELRSDIAEKEALRKELGANWSAFRIKCKSVNVGAQDPKAGLDAAKGRNTRLRKKLSALNDIVQELRKYAAAAQLQSEIAEKEAQIEQLLRQLAPLKERSDYLREWHERLSDLEAAVTGVQASAVGSHLEQLGPTIQQLYHRLNPHPVFGAIRVLVDDSKHQLELYAGTSVPVKAGTEVAPLKFFSDAQMNVLATTVFLAGALQQGWSKLQTIILDDPIQQMDEMNVCAFLDLLRFLPGAHQLVVLTCDRDFYWLALEKLSPLNQQHPGKFMAYKLEGSASSGEVVVHSGLTRPSRDTAN